MVADAVVYHPAVSHYLKYVGTTVGRDKLLRTLQFFSRFLSWYLFRTNHPTSTIAPFDAIKKQFGLTRKILRIGKFVEHFRAAAQASDAKNMDPVLRYCAVGRQLGYGGYMLLDNLTVVDAAGIRSYSAAKRLQREAYKFWIAGLVFNTTAGLYTLYQLKQRAAAVDKKDGEGVVESKKLERERTATTMQLVSDLCDLTVPSTALGYAGFDDGFIGLAGTVSSLLGVYSVWKKTA
ncbi:peroxisomal biogenesis factor 11 [Eremomyces bilateralis CBS 781.70]|uniref:Peroxisomal biogenesis factor 11 n=1 Tax=Eremomyces bilateralis CBS 781.70 TaxID=1392243 RepID=A0A6G1FV11_9PEZI|nr:peroxisomal biogenesis factor 11 [Eremomyces bilateralis CBS 781.70]KAF1809735.1 peroxisomal biogenesis factor 11 [Eremomyces bilateralis CBS 781.70]